MTPALEIRVAQIRNQYDALGQAVADLVRDAYAAGRSDGLAGRVDRSRRPVVGELDVDDVAQRRPTVV